MIFRRWNPLHLLLLISLVFTSGQFVHADSKPYYKYPLALLPDDKVPTSSQDSIERQGSSSAFGQFGAVLVKGDFNNDSFDDLAVSSPYYSTKDKKHCGMVEVYFGGDDFFVSMAQPERKPDLQIFGSTIESQLGTSLAVGDITGDSLDDLIIGSPGSNTVYALYGRKNMVTPRQYDFSSFSPDWTLRGTDPEERFGFAVDATDLNGDHIADILISAPFSRKDQMKRVGKVYGVYGKTYTPSFYNQNMLHVPADLVFWGSRQDDRFGISLAHGDIDGDNKADLAVGSYMATNGTSKQAGTVTLIQGSKLLSKNKLEFNEQNSDELNHDTSTLLTADKSFDWFGYSLAFGDLNSDGADDLVMSAFPFLRNNKQGNVYILWGEKNGSFQDKKLSRIIGPSETSLLGSAVGVADLDHDGAPDLLIGAATSSPGNDEQFGKFYALSVFPRNKDLWDFSKIPADLTITGRAEKDWFGNSFVIADFDNDGNRDIVIGAPNSRNNGVTTGSVELIQGPIIPHGDASYTLPAPSDFLSRGSFMVQVNKSLKLDEKNKEFIDSCMENTEFCFFQFSSQTKFANLRYSPSLRLYPDVRPSDPYYKAINIATILGIVHGYSDEPNSPFHPEKPISRIHALKILLSSAGMLPWKDYSDLRNELLKRTDEKVAINRNIINRDPRDKNVDPIASQKTPYLDISARISYMWWYPRYVNFAYLSGIINDSVFFQPDAPLTQKDFDQWMTGINEYLSRHQ